MRRFVEPVAPARTAALLYLGILLGISTGVFGLLVFLALYLAPHGVMAALGVGCVHKDQCLHGLPLWAQMSLWIIAGALLAWFLGRTVWSGTSLLLNNHRLMSLVRSRGRVDGRTADVPVCEIDDEGIVAHTAGMMRPLIVVSSGLAARLSAEEYEAVLAHERAHAAARDNLSLLLAAVVEKTLFFIPGVKAAHRGLRRSLEVAADAAAGRRTGDRLLVAGSVERVARLMFEEASVRRAPTRTVLASFGHDELVAERVRRLISDRPFSRPRRAAALAVLVLTLTVLGTSVYGVAGDNIAVRAGAGACVAGTDRPADPGSVWFH